jgi:hypothetical protein
MDILAYEYLKKGLEDFNEKSGKPYGNVIVAYPTSNTTYPHTVLDEIRNVGTNLNSDFERVASVGYVVRIYAKTKGNITKQNIARTVAQMVDNYMRHFALTRISYNANENINDSSIYEVIITYSGNLHENRRNFI